GRRDRGSQRFPQALALCQREYPRPPRAPRDLRDGHAAADPHGARRDHHCPRGSVRGKKLTGPNDVVVKSDGSFSDNGAGIRGNYLGHKANPELPYRVYRLDLTTGQLTIAVGDMKRPNGLAFSPDEKLLYVVDTPGPGQRTIQVYDVVDNGTKTA